MSALIEACRAPDFPARVALVVSNKPNAAGIQVAQDAGIDTVVVDHKAYENKRDFEGALLERIDPNRIDLICLAGFMRILSKHFIDGWEGGIINIHPSLLPKYKGLDTHERALAAGDKEAGCTVHYVIPEMDSGEIIVQKIVPVLPGDTSDSLAARVLVQEHIAYPEAVRILADRLKTG